MSTEPDPAASQVPPAPDETGVDPSLVEERMEEETVRSLRGENHRILILVGVVAAFMLVAHFSPLRAWITNVQEWKAALRSLGWLGHGLFASVCAVAVMLGIPRLPLCAAAGLLFGFGAGSLLSLAGSAAGSYGAFVMARRGARRAVLAHAEKRPWLAALLARPSWQKVFWVRQLMLPGLLLNVLLGVSAVRHRTFIAGTLAGYLPLNLAFSLVGSGLGKGSLAQTMTQLLAALAVVHGAAWLVWRFLRASYAPKP